MSIVEIAQSASPFALPLTSQFRQTTMRTGVVIAGSSGWGEFAPFPEYDAEVSGKWLAGALEAAFGNFPTKLRTEIPVNAIIPILDLAGTRAAVTNAVANYGMSTIKVKVNDGTAASLGNDIDRIKAVRETLDAMGVEGKIRIDVNGTWLPAEASESLSLLNEAAGGLDFVEQPCATIAELLELKKLMSTWSAPIKIAVDESIRLNQSLDISAIRDVADVVILKAIPLGGVAKALELALAIDLPVVVSGSLDSSVGLSSGISLAASVPNLYGACGLGTGLLFARDLVTETTTPVAGLIPVRRSSPDATLLSQAGAGVTETEREWWRTRIIEAWHASACDLVSPEIREAVEI